MKFVLFGDGEWACNSLERLLQEGYACRGVVLRVHPSDACLEAFARATGLPVFAPHNVNSNEFLDQVLSLNPDLNVSISFNQIFGRAVINSAPRGFVNFHAGMLPRYRGRNVINWAIINGETEIGLTSHYVDEGIDTGDIILQQRLPIGWTDGYGEVLRRVIGAFPALVTETLGAIAAGNAPRLPQDHDSGTYVPGRQDGDESIDWQASSRNVHNLIRGIGRPGPGARTVVGKTEVIVWRAHYEPAWPVYHSTAGTVVGRTHEGVVVKTGDSTILLKEVQMSGREPCVPRWAIGTRLGERWALRLCALERRVAAIEELVTRGRETNASTGRDDNRETTPQERSKF